MQTLAVWLASTRLSGFVNGHFWVWPACETLHFMGLTLLIGWSLGWVFLAISAWARRADTVQNLSFMVLFILTFASSAYVPVRDLPTVLRVAASANPLTYAINAIRAILLQTPGGTGAIGPAILISLAIGAAGTFAAVLLFRRPLDAIRR